VVACISATARAEPTEADIATARELATQGLAAQDAGDHATAEDRFRRASELYPAPTVLLGLARARVKLGKYVEAREGYLRITRMRLPPNASDAFRDAQQTAAVEVKEVEPKLAWLTLTTGTQPAGMDISLDGAAFPAAAIGVRRPINPGSHRVRATADDHAPFESSFTVGEGQDQTVTVTLRPQAVAGGSPWFTVGLVAIGVGGAGLIVGAVTGGIAVSKESELEDQCTGGRCEAEQYETLDSYELTSTISTVAFIAGGVLAAAGVTLVVVDVAGSDSQTVALSLGAGTARLTGTW
jgi:hypothetical protein